MSQKQQAPLRVRLLGGACSFCGSNSTCGRSVAWRNYRPIPDIYKGKAKLNGTSGTRLPQLQHVQRLLAAMLPGRRIGELSPFLWTVQGCCCIVNGNSGEQERLRV